ncbi:MAG: AMP-binding protein [Planctomycetes bacterium]|nr:AMP-binding protein [Planctomycetota bacterium]
MPPWLERSWRDVPEFMRSLAAEQATSLPLRPKSAVLERYDFCFDLLSRQGRVQRAAFRWHDRLEGWQEFSYADLDELSARKAAEWTEYGVVAGQTVCVLLPVGPEWVLAVLATIRLGCVLSLLPPAGKRFHALRLAALGPDHVVATPLAAGSLGESRALVIPDDLPPLGPRRESCVLPSGAIFASLFSPLATAPHLPLELTIDDAYCVALRDGLLAHGLRTGSTFAAPDADLLQYQPSLLLATLLVGGTYVHLELEDIAADPVAFAALELDTVGVFPRVRDCLLEAEVQLGKSWGHWWRGVSEESNHQRWHQFATVTGLKSVPASNLLVDSSAGGAVLFSARRRAKHGGMSYLVQPGAGVEWALAPMGAPSAEGSPPSGEGQTQGVFCPNSLTGTPWPGGHILRRQEEEWFYVGAPWATREGRVYPAGEVLLCLEDLPFVEGASVVTLTTGDLARPYSFSLVVFVGRAHAAELKAELDAWRRIITAEIDNGLSPTYRPDRIELFALSPRRIEGEVDHAWCRDLHARGLLYQRATRETYAVIDALRDLAKAPSPDAREVDESV